MNPEASPRADLPVPDRPRHLGLVRWLVGTATATAAVLAVTLGGPTDPGAAPGTAAAGPGPSATASTSTAPGATPEPDAGPIDPDAGPIDPDAAERGAAVFVASCAVCHGADAGGASGPSLVGVVARDGASAVEAVIRAGRGAMPAWQNRLGDDEIADLLAYLATGP